MVNFDVRQYKPLSIRSQCLPSDKQNQIFRYSNILLQGHDVQIKDPHTDSWPKLRI